jgi:hypothetical protein
MKAILDFRFAILDFGRGKAAQRRASNPKSKIQNPKSGCRRGVSILEVMFAILVTTVGLLGAVAVFPAASAMARKGRLNDAAAAAGRHAVHDFDVRGMRRPDRWWGYSTNWHLPPPSPPFPNPPLAPNPPNYFSIQSGRIAWPAGTAFCIDPRMIAFYESEYFGKTNLSTIREKISLFPAEDRTSISNVVENAKSYEPRMFRLSLFSGNSTLGFEVMRKLQADSIFTFEDDLSFLRPEDDRSKPALQLPIDPKDDWTTTKRLSDGHLSWMATLVPKVALVEKPIPGSGAYMTGQPTDEYVLSIVVFNDREFIPDQFESAYTDVPTERLVVGRLEGDGSTGGEIQLYANDARWLKLRSNDWVLLAGVYTYTQFGIGGSVQRLTNVPAFQWYRVTDCDTEPEQSNVNLGGTNYTQTLYASLMGQDWNKDIVNPRFGASGTNTFQATIVQGVVAVYEKTVRLEYGNAL